MKEFSKIIFLSENKPSNYVITISLLYETLQKRCLASAEWFTLKKRDYLKRKLFKSKNNIYLIFNPVYLDYINKAVLVYDDPFSQTDTSYSESESLNNKKILLIITPTIQIKNYLLTKGVKKKIEVIPFPIHTDIFLPVNSDDGNTVGVFGFLYGNRISFIRDIGKKLPEKINFVTNDENLAGELKESRTNLTVFPRISFGENIKISEYFNRLTIGLAYSDNGRFGTKILQYMSCGKPVIANDSPENQFIEEQKAGFLVKSPGEAVEKIIYLLNDKKLRMEMGKNGRKYVEQNYNKSMISEKFIEIIENKVNF